MTRTTRITLTVGLVLSFGAVSTFAQTQKGQSSSTPKTEAPKTASSEKGSAAPSSSSEKQTQTKPTTGAQARELSPEQKRDATKIQVLTLTTSPGGIGSILAKGTFKVELPDGIKVKGFDVLFETQFSNGETRRETFSIGGERRDVETAITLPGIGPPFDCRVCLNLAQLEKGKAIAVGRQCAQNNCPTPPSSTSGGSKDSPKEGGNATNTVKSSTPSTTGVRSASNGVVFADPTSVKVTVTGHFTDGSASSEFTRADSRAQTKFVTAKVNK